MIAAHYDAVALRPPPRVAHQHRRQEHNTVKRLLLQQSVVMLQGNVKLVADLACGKGGDLNKVAELCPYSLYVGVDVSGESLAELERRAS